MSFLEYIKDKLNFILWLLFIFIIISSALIISNVNFRIIIFLSAFYFLPVFVFMTIEFIKLKKYYQKIYIMFDNLDKKYLLPELLEKPGSIEEEKIDDILKDVLRDMHENVKFYRDIQQEYREYIELWVHEIKTPISSAKLIIENDTDECTKRIDYELEKIENYVEQVLYYSRSDNPYKDYVIRKMNLGDSVRNVIRKNYRDFIHKKIKIELKNVDKEIHQDKKWIEFILNQIVTNSIKYSKKNDAEILIYIEENDNSTSLIIEDNGEGIPQKDIERVFEKGFTGENGRKFGKSTGIGLYLVKTLREAWNINKDRIYIS